MTEWELGQGEIKATDQEYKQRVQQKGIPEKIRQGSAMGKGGGRRVGRQPGLHSRSKELMPVVKDLIKQGYSYRKIAEEVGLSKNTVQAIVKALQQDQAPLAVDWSLFLDLKPGDWLGLNPFWEHIAKTWRASVWLSVGGELLGTGTIPPLTLAPQDRHQLEDQGYVLLSHNPCHYWVGMVSTQPERLLWGIREQPWTPEHLEMWQVICRRLGRYLRLWLPWGTSALQFRLPAALQALDQQLRDPVSSLRMGMLMLSQAQLTERQQRYLRIIQAEQQRFQDLVREWQSNLMTVWQEPVSGSLDFAKLCPATPVEVLAELEGFQTDPELVGILAQVTLRNRPYQVQVVWAQQQRWWGWQIVCQPPLAPEDLESVQSLVACLKGEVIWDPPQLRVWIPDLSELS